MTDLPRDHDADEFVGESRHRFVDGLLKVYDLVVATQLPTWVSLEGPSGWGKTRVIQEFYARLAAERQDQPEYWPATMTSDDDSAHPDRKRIDPLVVHRPGSRPQWAWWGITCAQRNGVASVALAQDVAVLEAHAPYLELTWRARNPRGVAVSALKGASLAGADFAVGTVAEVVLPGFDLAKRLAQFTLGAARGAGERRSLERGAGNIAASHEDAVAGIAETIVRLAAGGIPVVIVVEDAHAADATLAALLHDLIAQTGPILILTTSWPGHVDENVHLRRAMGSYPERLMRVTSDDERLPRPFASEAGLGQLPDDALASIARRVLPPADDATVGRIVARYPNPLALELFGSLPALRSRARGGELVLSDEQLARFPSSLVGLYNEVWDELPDDVRHALALATLGIPEAISPGAGSPYWNRRMLADVVREIGLPSADDLAGALTDAPTAYQWARSVSDALRAFTEPEQLRVAANAEFGYITDEEKSAVHDALVRRAAEALADQADPTDESMHAAQLILALHGEGFVTDAAPAVVAALHVLRALRWQNRELATREALVLRALGFATGAEDRLELIVLLAELYRGVGRNEQAGGLLRDELTVATFELGDEHPAVLRARFELAGALSGEGEVEQAFAEGTAVWQIQRRTLGDDHPDTLRSRSGIAADLAILEGSRAALPLYEEVFADRTRVLGPTHEATLSTGAAWAWALAACDRHTEALALVRRLRERAEPVLGAANSEVLQLRAGESAFLTWIGHEQAGALILEELRLVVETALGAYDPITLWVSSLYAETWVAAGVAAPAIEEHEKLVTARLALVGPSHPQTLDAQASLAGAIAIDDPPRAAQLFDELAERSREALGDDSAGAMFAALSAVIFDHHAGLIDDGDRLDRLDRLAVQIERVIATSVSPRRVREARPALRAVRVAQVEALAVVDSAAALALAEVLAAEEVVRADASPSEVLGANLLAARMLAADGQSALALERMLALLEQSIDLGDEHPTRTALRLAAVEAASDTGDEIQAAVIAFTAANVTLAFGITGSPRQLEALFAALTHARAAEADDEADQAMELLARNAVTRLGLTPLVLTYVRQYLERLREVDDERFAAYAAEVFDLLEADPPAHVEVIDLRTQCALGLIEGGRSTDAQRLLDENVVRLGDEISRLESEDADVEVRLELRRAYAQFVGMATGSDAAAPLAEALLVDVIGALGEESELAETVRGDVRAFADGHDPRLVSP